MLHCNIHSLSTARLFINYRFRNYNHEALFLLIQYARFYFTLHSGLCQIMRLQHLMQLHLKAESNCEQCDIMSRMF